MEVVLDVEDQEHCRVDEPVRNEDPLQGLGRDYAQQEDRDEAAEGIAVQADHL